MKTNTETKILESINILLGAEKELIVLKGQLQNPVRREKKDTRETYYEFVVKTLRKNSDDEYGQGYNRYHCVMPSDVAKNFNDDLIKELKGNEVPGPLQLQLLCQRVQEGRATPSISQHIVYTLSTS